jgi:hypothetical protein
VAEKRQPVAEENELLLKIKEYECQITIFETQLVS